MVDDVDGIDIDNLGATSNSTATASIKSATKKRRIIGIESELATAFTKSLKRHEEREDNNNADSDRLFLLSLLEDFKKIPDRMKSEAKINIIRCISDAIYGPIEKIVPKEQNLFFS